VVEIDEAVYHAARRWFKMPEPREIFLEDARRWVAGRQRRLQAGIQQDLFDIVVHDCFSGGGVPEHMFTLEFWNDLKALMAPNGVLAVVSQGFFCQ
jgi:spermidine synthase